jgi:hypothetical protein
LWQWQDNRAWWVVTNALLPTETASVAVVVAVVAAVAVAVAVVAAVVVVSRCFCFRVLLSSSAETVIPAVAVLATASFIGQASARLG